MSVLDRWSDVQWISVPRWLITRWAGLRGLAGDGHTLVTLPLIAAFAPVIAFAAGLACGVLHLGYTDVYTESTLLMASVLALGSFSGQLGVLAVTGLCLGDLSRVGMLDAPVPSFSSSIWFKEPFVSGVLGSLVHLWLPRLISYLLLFAGAVMLPRAVRAVIGAVGQRRAVPPLASWSVVSGLMLVITWLGMDAWVAAAPTLVRPVFTWATSNGVPTVEAVTTLQGSGKIVVAAAVAAVLIRQLLIGSVMLPGRSRDRLLAAEQTAPDIRGTAAEPGSVPGTGRQLMAALLTSLLATVAMAGILERAWLWFCVFAVLVLIRVARTGLVLVPGLATWQRIAALAPAWARLITLWLVSRVIVQSLSSDLIGSYTGLAIFVLASILIVFAVFPGTPAPAAEPLKVGVA